MTHNFILSSLRRFLGIPFGVLLCALGAQPALTQSVRPYGEFNVGAYFPTAGGGAWETLDDVYGDYHWVNRDSFSSGEDFIGPLVKAKAGLLIWEGLDLCASIGYTWSEANIEKSTDEARYDWRRRGGGHFAYQDSWDLNILPLSVTAGWNFFQWSIVRPYVEAGADLYLWQFKGEYESPGDHWRDYAYDESFSEDGADVGAHAVLGCEFGHPAWWISVVIEGSYTACRGDLKGDFADFSGEDEIDLSGWSVMVGPRFRSPYRSEAGPALPGPPSGGAPSGARLRTDLALPAR